MEYIFDLDSLSAYSDRELEQIFLAADSPDFNNLQGKFRGRSLANSLPYYLPPFLKKAHDRRPLRFRTLWRGKEFVLNDKGVKGVNLYWKYNHPIRAHKFDVSGDVSVIDGRPCAVAVYPFGKDPMLFKNIRYELREIEKGAILTRTTFEHEEKSIFITYIGLIKT